MERRREEMEVRERKREIVRKREGDGKMGLRNIERPKMNLEEGDEIEIQEIERK